MTGVLLGNGHPVDFLSATLLIFFHFVLQTTYRGHPFIATSYLLILIFLLFIAETCQESVVSVLFTCHILIMKIDHYKQRNPLNTMIKPGSDIMNIVFSQSTVYT